MVDLKYIREIAEASWDSLTEKQSRCHEAAFKCAELLREEDMKLLSVTGVRRTIEVSWQMKLKEKVRGGTSVRHLPGMYDPQKRKDSLRTTLGVRWGILLLIDYLISH